jgi:hypothetical protein
MHVPASPRRRPRSPPRPKWPRPTTAATRTGPPCTARSHHGRAESTASKYVGQRGHVRLAGGAHRRDCGDWALLQLRVPRLKFCWGYPPTFPRAGIAVRESRPAAVNGFMGEAADNTRRCPMRGASLRDAAARRASPRSPAWRCWRCRDRRSPTWDAAVVLAGRSPPVSGGSSSASDDRRGRRPAAESHC